MEVRFLFVLLVINSFHKEYDKGKWGDRVGDEGYAEQYHGSNLLHDDVRSLERQDESR